MTKTTTAAILVGAFAAFAWLPTVVAQNAQAGRGGAAETWWVNKTRGGVYNPPMRPLWKLSDLKQMHAGQNNWQEPIIKDPEQDATYNSAAPGSRFTARLHPDTPTVFVVIAGDMRFTVEGQPPVTATRGSIVNIMKTTMFSYEAAGNQTALWVEVNPANYKTAYPASGPEPAAASGGQTVKVSFTHTPGAYTPPNQLHWNLFDDGIGKCAPAAARVTGRSPLCQSADWLRESSRQQVSRRSRQRRRRTGAGDVQCEFDIRPHARGAGGVVDRAGWRDQRQVRKHRRVSCGRRRCALCRADDLASDGRRSTVRSVSAAGDGRISAHQHEQHGGAVTPTRRSGIVSDSRVAANGAPRRARSRQP